MNTTQYGALIINELSLTMEKVEDESCEKLCEAILTAKKIFVAGAGRSGLCAKAFAMRLMHLGFTAYVCGETVTPNLESDDLFLIVSASGETGSLVAMAKKSKQIGATIALLTAIPESTIGNLSDMALCIPAPTPKVDNSFASIQPMGSLFEQSSYILLDAVVIRIMELNKIDSEDMFNHHANLE